MQRIGFYISSLGSGGAERVCCSLSGMLSNRNEYCYVSTSVGRDSDFYSLEKSVHREELNFYYGSSMLRKALEVFVKLVKTQASIRRNKPDVIVAMCSSEIIKQVLVKKIFLNKYKIISCEHNNYYAVKGLKRKLRDWAMKNSDFSIVLTEKDYFEYRQKGIFTEVIPNPNHLQIIKDAKSLSDSEVLNIVMIGRLTKQKGYDHLLKIAKLIKRHSVRKMKIRIYGEGALEEHIRTQILSQGLSEVVELCGVTHNVLDVYQAADLYIMTSNYEGLPMTLIEASSQGIPCICFDCDTGPRQILKGANNSLVPCFDYEMFFKKLQEVTTNKALYREMSSESLHSAKYFEPGEILNKWEEILER